MRRLRVFFSIWAMLMTAGCATAISQSPAATVRTFYEAYLGNDAGKTPTAARSEIAMSKSFSEAIRRNAEICRKYVEGPCGWGADGDEYLDAQETDPKLTYESSGITIKEIRPDTVQVKLNVYPSIKDAKRFYDRTITFKMVREKGAWVVDDVASTDGTSARKRMAGENDEAIAHPDRKAPEKAKKAFHR